LAQSRRPLIAPGLEWRELGGKVENVRRNSTAARADEPTRLLQVHQREIPVFAAVMLKR
jgi:hypothetical protein